MGAFGNGVSICGAVKTTLEKADGLKNRLRLSEDERYVEELKELIREIGFQWLKANEGEKEFIKEWKSISGVKDHDILTWAPIISRADAAATESWEEEFGSEEDEEE